MRAPLPCPICQRVDATTYAPGRYPVDGRETAVCLRTHDGGGCVVFFVDDGSVAHRRKLSAWEQAWSRCEPASARGVGGHFLDERCGIRRLTEEALAMFTVGQDGVDKGQLYAAGQLMKAGAVMVAPLWDGWEPIGWELRAVDAERGLRPGDAEPHGTGKLARMLGRRGLFIPSRLTAPGLAVVVVEGIWDAVTLHLDLFDRECHDIAPAATGGSTLNPQLIRNTLDIYWPDTPRYLLADADEAGLQQVRRLVHQEQIMAGHIRLGGEDAKDYREADPKTRLSALLDAVERAMSGPSLPVQEPPPSSDTEVASSGSTVTPTFGAEYSIEDGHTVHFSERFGTRALANFRAEILEEITVVDGVRSVLTYKIGGELADGRRLPELQVSAGDFGKMAWVSRWGAAAIPAAGPTVLAHLRTAIQTLSHRVNRSITYTHTGWTRHEEEWVFLHGDGAIGARGRIPDIRIELPGVLSDYRLGVPLNGQELTDVLEMALGLLSIDVDEVTVPLFGFVVRAPLGPAPYTIFLTGRTGVLKSTKAALFLTFFGSSWDTGHLPAAWSDTTHSLNELLFLAKDLPVVIDDAVPEGGMKASQDLQKALANVIRAQANGHARSRLDQEMRFVASRDSRCSLAVTSEDQVQGLSAQARTIQAQVPVGTTDLSLLTQAQAIGRAGRFSQVMASFIVWLADRKEALPDLLTQRQDNVLDRFSGPHLRAPKNLSDLYAGLEIFGDFCRESGIAPERVQEFLRRSLAALQALGRAQVIGQTDVDPVWRFLELLDAALISGECHVDSVRGGIPDLPGRWGWRPDAMTGTLRPQGKRVGFAGPDGQLFLLPKPAWTLVRRQSQAEGEPLLLSASTMWRRLAEAHVLWSPESDRNVFNGPVVDGHRHKVVCLPDFDAALARCPRPRHQAGHGETAAPIVPFVPVPSDHTELLTAWSAPEAAVPTDPLLQTPSCSEAP